MIEYTDIKVYIGTDDWSKADGAALTEDDRVIPVIDLTPHVRSVAFKFVGQEISGDGYSRGGA